MDGSDLRRKRRGCYARFMIPGKTTIADRYSRQIRFAGVGQEGQDRIGRSTAVLVGCGALGSLQAESLARAGVGRLRIIDRDSVEWSNLQRQFLFDEADAEAGTPKSIAAAKRLAMINSEIEVAPEVADLTAANIEDLLDGADVILDGTDNFETRYLVNDYAVRQSIPWIYGAAVASYGLAMPILPGRTACFACVYPSAPSGEQQTCETAGVLGALTALVAAWQCGLALKVLSGHAGKIEPCITTFEIWNGVTRQMRLPASDPDCPVCGKRVFRYLDGRKRAPISLCGRNAVQIHERSRPVDLHGLAARLSGLGEIRCNEFALRVNLDNYEMTVFPDGRAIIKGTTDIAVARSMYSRYVGN